jgi:predicted AAA+ superfamily ATPase
MVVFSVDGILSITESQRSVAASLRILAASKITRTMHLYVGEIKIRIQKYRKIYIKDTK